MTSFLSLNTRIQQHIEQIKDSYSRILYYGKQSRVISYIEKSTVFTINEILTQMHKDKIAISHYTVAKVCNYLVIDNLLNKFETNTKFKNITSLYFRNNVSVEEINNMRDYYKELTSKPQKD